MQLFITIGPNHVDIPYKLNKMVPVPVIVLIRAVDPHSFYADPDPAVFLNADPDPGPGPGPGPA